VPIDKRWEKFGHSDWTAFAEAWLTELRVSTSDTESDVGMSVTLMNFTATPEQQWRFILVAVSLAESDDELGHIAAGPIEHLLGWHGEGYIDIVEQQAAKDLKFARTLTGVWQYKMTDDVWSRIQVLQEQVNNPLQCSTDTSEKA
jgi:hypothetical protein